MDLHILPYALLKVSVFGQRPSESGAGNDQGVGILDGVIHIKCVGKEPAHILAVADGHTAVLVNVNIEKKFFSFSDIFHIVDPDPELLRDRGRDGLRALFILLISGFSGLFFLHMYLSEKCTLPKDCRDGRNMSQ